MRKPVLMPEIGVTDAKVSVWFAKPGDSVYAGDRLVEVLVDGATIAVSSPANGRLVEKSAFPDDAVTSGQILGAVEVAPDADS